MKTIIEKRKLKKGKYIYTVNNKTVYKIEKIGNFWKLEKRGFNAIDFSLIDSGYKKKETVLKIMMAIIIK